MTPWSIFRCWQEGDADTDGADGAASDSDSILTSRLSEDTKSDSDYGYDSNVTGSDGKPAAREPSFLQPMSIYWERSGLEPQMFTPPNGRSERLS